MTFAVMADDCY